MFFHWDTIFVSKSLNAALRQLARAAACRWIAWVPFLYSIAKFLLQLSLPMWMGAPTSLNRILWQVLYHYAGGWWECLWFCWPLVVCRLREEASKHTLCWGVLRVCAVWFIVGWVHALWISAKQTSWWVLGIFLVWVNVGSGLCCPVVVCMFCEEAFKQTSLCWGVLGSLWWVNVGSVCWGLCLGSLMASGGLRAQWKGFQTKFIMLGSVTGFCGLAFEVHEQVSTYSLFWRGNLPFLLVWCVPFLQMLWRICYCWKKKVRC